MGEIHEKDYDLSYKVGQLVGRLDSVITRLDDFIDRFEKVVDRVDNHDKIISKGSGIAVALIFFFSIISDTIVDFIKNLFNK